MLTDPQEVQATSAFSLIAFDCQGALTSQDLLLCNSPSKAYPLPTSFLTILKYLCGNGFNA